MTEYPEHDLTGRLLVAAEKELGRQAGAHASDLYVEKRRRDPDEWIIDGHVDLRALVEAVSREMAAAMREWSEREGTACDSPDSKSFEDGLAGFARQHGTEAG
jgi:hypothetical protein